MALCMCACMCSAPSGCVGADVHPLHAELCSGGKKTCLFFTLDRSLLLVSVLNQEKPLPRCSAETLCKTRVRAKLLMSSQTHGRQP